MTLIMITSIAPDSAALGLAALVARGVAQIRLRCDPRPPRPGIAMPASHFGPSLRAPVVMLNG